MADTSALFPENSGTKQLINLNNCTKIFNNIFPVKKKTLSISKKIVYRYDNTTVDKIIETDSETGDLIKIIHYSYFDDKKINSVEEFENGIKIRETKYNFFKIVSDFDKTSGKKIRTSNFDMETGTKIISVYDYDIETEKLVRMSVYRPDGKSIAFIKEISPETGMLTRCINYKRDSKAISSVSQYKLAGDTCIRTTYYYKTPLYVLSETQLENKITADTLNERVLCKKLPHNTAKLIDNLYKNKENKNMLKIS